MARVSGSRGFTVTLDRRDIIAWARRYPEARRTLRGLRELVVGYDAHADPFLESARCNGERDCTRWEGPELFVLRLHMQCAGLSALGRQHWPAFRASCAHTAADWEPLARRAPRIEQPLFGVQSRRRRRRS